MPFYNCKVCITLLELNRFTRLFQDDTHININKKSSLYISNDCISQYQNNLRLELRRRLISNLQDIPNWGFYWVQCRLSTQHKLHRSDLRHRMVRVFIAPNRWCDQHLEKEHGKNGLSLVFSQSLWRNQRAAARNCLLRTIFVHSRLFSV